MIRSFGLRRLEGLVVIAVLALLALLILLSADLVF